MMRLFPAVLVLVLALDASAEDTKTNACSLLTSTEIGGELGGKVGEPQGSNIPITKGPAKGETTAMCMWSTDGGGMLSVAVVRLPKGTDRAAGMATLTHALDALKAKGWAEEKQDFANARCMIMTPPAGKDNLPLSTGCFAEASGKGISVGAMGKTKVPIGKVKALLDKAIGRLH